ncbi:MAG: hypothetical protein J2P20_10560, partial [Pseudonocardia sp.]|nr:hypothetical protein [Pseudonocardia sp.]
VVMPGEGTGARDDDAISERQGEPASADPAAVERAGRQRAETAARGYHEGAAAIKERADQAAAAGRITAEQAAAIKEQADREAAEATENAYRDAAEEAERAYRDAARATPREDGPLGAIDRAMKWTVQHIADVATQAGLKQRDVWNWLRADPEARYHFIDGHVVRRIGGGSVDAPPDSWSTSQRIDPLEPTDEPTGGPDEAGPSVGGPSPAGADATPAGTDATPAGANASAGTGTKPGEPTPGPHAPTPGSPGHEATPPQRQESAGGGRPTPSGSGSGDPAEGAAGGPPGGPHPPEDPTKPSPDSKQPPREDETSGLDPPAKQSIFSMLREVIKQRNEFRGWSREQLHARFAELARQVRGGQKTVRDAAVECTALACAAAELPTKQGGLGKKPRVHQIYGALHMALDGRIIQMLTGEGKTIAGALAVVVRSLDARTLDGRPAAGRGVQWLAPDEASALQSYKTVRKIAKPLGVSVELLGDWLDTGRKVRTYRGDIVIGPVSEFVFDRLRDQDGTSVPVQGDRGGFRLIDEVDLVLLDDGAVPYRLAEPMLAGKGRRVSRWVPMLASAAAKELRNPGTLLTISDKGRVRLTAEGRTEIRRVMRGLDRGVPVNRRLIRQVERELTARYRVHDEVDWAGAVADRLAPREGDSGGHFVRRGGWVELTSEGRAFIENDLPDLPDGTTLRRKLNSRLEQRLEQALAVRNIEWYRDGHGYLREGDQITLTDEAGRRLPDRTYERGLQQAIEQYEGLPISAGTRTVAAMYIKEFLGDKPWAGMTGTVGGADGEASFRQNYGKKEGVEYIRPHRKPLRKNLPTVWEASAAEARDAAVAYALQVHRQDASYPLLIIARTVREAEKIAEMLRAEGIEPNMITARREHVANEEAAIANAGRRGAVTVATPRAGRAVDIQLGGEVEHLTDEVMRDNPGLDRARARKWAEHIQSAEFDNLNVEGGGLHVVGLGYLKSLRLEMQLRGRAGRQGQHGTT